MASFWSAPKHALRSRTIFQALRNEVMPTMSNYPILSLRCMFNDESLERYEAYILARRKLLEMELEKMEEVSSLYVSLKYTFMTTTSYEAVSFL